MTAQAVGDRVAAVAILAEGLVRARDEGWIPQEPTEKQKEFLLRPEREVFFGGAAGGGKSSALLMGALQFVHVPGYNAIIFRRTFTDLSLPGALMDRAREWLQGTSATWRQQEHTWTFPSGATLTFGYMEQPNQRWRYASSEYQYIAFDELTQFEEICYTFMFSRLRKTRTIPVPLRMRAASNPGGAGHDWVKRRFLDARHADRLFVPSRIVDNPHLDAEEYMQSLLETDPITGKQLIEGSWEVRHDGGLFRREWFVPVDLPSIPVGLQRIRYWDMAGTAEPAPGVNADPDYTVGALVGRDHAGYLYLLDVQRFRCNPAEVAQRVREVAAQDGPTVTIYVEQEPGGAGKALVDHYVREVLPGYAVYGHRPTGDKVTRAKPLAAKVRQGYVRVPRGAPWLADLYDEFEVFPYGNHDDQVDAVAAAVQLLSEPKVQFFL